MKSILTSLFSLVLCATLHAQIPSYVPADGLVGWWPFNGNANDESGNGNHGVVNGAVLASDRNGVVNAAYSFDGINDFILSNNFDLIQGNVSRTFSFWIKYSNVDAGGWVISYGPQAADFPCNDEYHIEAKMLADCNFPGIGVGVPCAQKRFEFLLNDNVWRNFTVVYDGTGLANTKLYVNGILHTDNYCIDNVGIATELATNVPSGGISFGKRNDNLGFLDGSLDDIAIYNRALTPTEITQLYTAAEEPVATCAPLAPNLQNGLVGYWPFCGNANDESGNGNNGVVNGATLAEDRFGNANAAFDFDGDDYITLASIDQLGLDASSFSISVWVNSYEFGVGNGENIIIGTPCWAGGSDEGFFIANSPFLNPNGNYYSKLGIDEIAYCFSSTNYDLDKWYHLLISYDNINGEFKLFVNSEFISSSILIGSPLSNPYPISVGAFVGPWIANFLTGSVDDIAIYNRALTPVEITQLYTAAEEPVASCAPLAPNLQNGLVGYWPFCGNANDESGNGNNGVVNGATLAEDRFGNANAAYNFDGNDGITMPPSDILNIGLSDFTISLFMKPSNSDGLKNIVGKRYYSLGNGYSVNIENGRVFSELLDANSTTYTGSTAEVALNEWQHVCATFDRDGNSSIYLNGQLEGSLPISGESGDLSNSSELFIGYFAPVGPDCYNGCLFFEGSLDDIAIYNRALTPEEITQLYAGNIAPCNLIASETQDTPIEVGGSAQLYVTLNAPDYSMQWQTNAAGLGWMDVQDNNTYTGSQTQNLLISNATLANHEQPFRIIVTDGICNDTSDVALLMVNNTCTAYDTITTSVEVFDTLTIENVVEVYDTLTIYNTIDIFDTTTVNVEVFDTITNVVDVFDTTTIYLQVDIFDTLFIDVYDTTYVQQTIDVYDTTYVTLTDTTFIQVIDTAYVTVTDTLLIDITFVGFEGQPSWLNTVLVYPNPASDHITIDYGNFTLMAGYNTVITDAVGATVYSGAVNSQQAYIDINAWGAAGVYYLSIYDVNGAVVAVRQIVIQ